MALSKVSSIGCLIIAGIMACYVPATAQTQKSRGLLQQEFIIAHFISPQFKDKGAWKMTSEAAIDSLFGTIEKAWTAVAPDTLRKYPMDVSPEDFTHIDAYCYFWTLMSISQTDDIPLRYTRYLVDHYMLPAVRRDFQTLQQRPSLTSIQLTHGGTLGNTLSLGSRSGMDKKTVLDCYRLYNEANTVFQSFSNDKDTAIRQYAKDQLHDLERFKYDLNAKNAFYNGDIDKAEMFVLTGLSVGRYSSYRISWFSGQLLKSLIGSGATDKSITLLNTLLMNTTPDILSRDTLQAWYRRADPEQGKALYEKALSKLSGSAFKRTGHQIQLPVAWHFIMNAIPAEKLNKAKYLLVDVWEIGCAPCVQEFPAFNQLYEKISHRDDVVFLSISADYLHERDNEDSTRKWGKTFDIHFPVVYDNADSKLNNQLGVRGYPSKFILDRSGELIAKTDNSEMSLDAFELFLNELK